MATALDDAAVYALRRGHDIARRSRLPLRVVHVTTGHARSTKAAVVRWAREAAGVALSPSAVAVRSGSRVAEIWREAHRVDARLLVLGGAVGGCTPGWLVRFLAQHARRPVLIASAGHGGAVIAATDLADPTLPVIQHAAALAEQIGASLRAVHNVDARAGRPHAPDVSSVAGLDDFQVTAERTPFEAVLRAATSSDADVVAVGAHETSGRTLRELLLHARRSVLAVPLGKPRRRAASYA